MMARCILRRHYYSFRPRPLQAIASNHAFEVFKLHFCEADAIKWQKISEAHIFHFSNNETKQTYISQNRFV